MSYSGNPQSSDKDAVRFLVKDTGTTENFTDDEIIFALATEGNIWLAAALLSDKMTIIASSGGLASKSVGGLSESYSQSSLQFWSSQAKLFRAKGNARQVPFSGDVPQRFSMEQFDAPGVGNPMVTDPDIDTDT